MLGIGQQMKLPYATASVAAAAAVVTRVKSQPCSGRRNTLLSSSFTSSSSSSSSSSFFSSNVLFSRYSNNKKVKYRSCHFYFSNNNNSSTASASTFTQLRSPNLVALEYADLNLNNSLNIGEVGHVRIRQHVNPLSASLSAPVEVPDWNQVFQDSTLPLMVDIGSGSGRFLLWLAKRSPETNNYLGLEIRYKLVDRAQLWVKELALKNIYFMFANATVSFEQLVSTYPGPLMFVSILCPDPHFKKRHHKRRVLQKILVDSMMKNLRPGGRVFIQSDVHEVALDMRNQFDAHSDMLQHVDDGVDQQQQHIPCDSEGWVLSNPLGIRTEREIHAECEGARIYRRMYQKR